MTTTVETGPPPATAAGQSTGDTSSEPADVIGLRAYRYVLDPTPTQLQHLQRHAGAARWAFNHALAAKVAAHQDWRRQVDQLLNTGLDEQTARARVKVPVPTKPTIQKTWNQVKDDDRTGKDGLSSWWHTVSTYAFQSAFTDADRAWATWLDSLAGGRRGRRVGYPRFKRRGRARDAFRLHHDVKRPAIRPVTYRRLRLPTLGELRIHGTLKSLVRAIDRGEAVIQSATVSRAGHRWHVSILCRTTTPVRLTTKAQTRAGTVGVDLGAVTLAALSTGETIRAPKHLKAERRRLTRAQRALSRTQPGSTRRDKARQRVARRHAEVAARRATTLHTLTKRLATSWDTVAIEDLNVGGMTRSARGTLEQPGTNVAAKAGLNRSILDAWFGEIRRQLEYKTRWWGSRLLVIDRWAPTSKTCSACGWRDPSQSLAERTFHCQSCGHLADRDVNAATNIAALAGAVDDAAEAPVDPPGRATTTAVWHAAVASDSGETRNARGGRIRPRTTGARQRPSKREGTPAVSPPRSDPRALPPRTSVQVSS